MQLNKLQKLIADTAKLKARYDLAKDKADNLKGKLDGKRFELLRLMASAGIKSQEDPTHQYLAIRANRQNIDVVDEALALDWLQRQPNVDAEFYVGLKLDRFTPLARTAFKQYGEIPFGCELRSEEYVAIRKQEMQNAKVR